MDPKSREEWIRWNDAQLAEPAVTEAVERGLKECDCGAGDLCTSVILVALIKGEANRDQQRDAAVQVLRRIFEIERREAIKEAFAQAVQLGMPPAGSEKGH